MVTRYFTHTLPHLFMVRGQKSERFWFRVPLRVPSKDLVRVWGVTFRLQGLPGPLKPYLFRAPFYDFQKNISHSKSKLFGVQVGFLV